MPEETVQDLYGQIDAYIQELFLPDDPALRIVVQSMTENNLRRINVPANAGRLLYLLARLVGAVRVLEIGTLGGYSAVWLARAVAPAGRVISLEADPHHAAVARKAIAVTDLADAIEIRLGDALDLMATMINQGEAPFDLIFIDADKEAYPRYLEAALQLARSGSLILADNVIRNGAVLRAPDTDAGARTMQQFNKTLATHPRLESLIVPLLGRQHIDGIAISRVR